MKKPTGDLSPIGFTVDDHIDELPPKTKKESRQAKATATAAATVRGMTM
jgi:hypothetical protein